MPHPTTLATLVRRRVAAVLAVLLAAPLGAQVVPEMTVRLFTRQLEIGRGVLVAADSSAVMLRRADGTATNFPFAVITRAELLAGTHRAGLSDIGKGAAIGFGVGGVFFLPTLALPTSSADREMAGLGAIAAPVVATVLGTVIGAATSFRYVDEWQPLDLRRIARSPAGQFIPPREISAGDTVRFDVGAERFDRAIVVRAAAGSLVVRPADGASETTFSASKLVRPEVLRGHRPMGMRAVAVGALIGAVAGVACGLRPHTGGGINSGHPIAAMPLLVGAAGGTALGSVVAALPTGNWRAFDPLRATTP